MLLNFCNRFGVAVACPLLAYSLRWSCSTTSLLVGAALLLGANNYFLNPFDLLVRVLLLLR